MLLLHFPPKLFIHTANFKGEKLKNIKRGKVEPMRASRIEAEKIRKQYFGSAEQHLHLLSTFVSVSLFTCGGSAKTTLQLFSKYTNRLYEPFKPQCF